MFSSEMEEVWTVKDINIYTGRCITALSFFAPAFLLQGGWKWGQTNIAFPPQNFHCKFILNTTKNVIWKWELTSVTGPEFFSHDISCFPKMLSCDQTEQLQAWFCHLEIKVERQNSICTSHKMYQLSFIHFLMTVPLHSKFKKEGFVTLGIKRVIFSLKIKVHLVALKEKSYVLIYTVWHCANCNV